MANENIFKTTAKKWFTIIRTWLLRRVLWSTENGSEYMLNKKKKKKDQ